MLLGLPLIALAVLGLFGPGRHRFMIGTGVVGLAGLALALVAPGLTVMTSVDGPRTPWVGVPLDVFGLACAGIALVGLAGRRPSSAVAKAMFHPASGAVAGAVACAVAGIAVWSGVVATLRPQAQPLPDVVQSQFTGPRSVRALVLTAAPDGSVTYRVQGAEVGQPASDFDLPVPSGGSQAAAAVSDLLGGQGDAAAIALHRLAIGFVVMTGDTVGRQQLTSTLQSGGALIALVTSGNHNVWRVVPQTVADGTRSVASSRILVVSGTGSAQTMQEVRSGAWHAATSVPLPLGATDRQIRVAEPAGWARTAEVSYAGRTLHPRVVDGVVSYALPAEAGRLSIEQRPTLQRTRTAQAALWLLVLFVALPFGNRASRRRAW